MVLCVALNMYKYIIIFNMSINNQYYKILQNIYIMLYKI